MLISPSRLPLAVLLWQRDLALDPTQRALLHIPRTVLCQDLLVCQLVATVVLVDVEVPALGSYELLEEVAVDGPGVALCSGGDARAADGDETGEELAGWEAGGFGNG